MVGQMNLVFQNILVFVVFMTAVVFLIRKFFWKPRKTAVSKKAPGSCGGSDCGCH